MRTHILPDTAHRTPGNTLSTLQEEHRFPPGSPTSERELRGISFLGSWLIFLSVKDRLKICYRESCNQCCSYMYAHIRA
jgi:hypothetical protein